MSRVQDAGADLSSSPWGPWACLVTWSASELEAAGAPVLPMLNTSKDWGGARRASHGELVLLDLSGLPQPRGGKD